MDRRPSGTRGKEPVVGTHVHADGIPLAHLAVDDQVGHVIHHLALDEALEWARTVDGVEAVEGKRLHCGRRELERDPLAGEACTNILELDVDDMLDVPETERMKDHHVVDSIEELRFERGAQGVVDLSLHLIGIGARTGSRDKLAPDVARHDLARAPSQKRAPEPAARARCR